MRITVKMMGNKRQEFPKKYKQIYTVNRKLMQLTTMVLLTPVLPDPVSAAISTSPPPNISGIASACTSVGNLKRKKT